MSVRIKQLIRLSDEIVYDFLSGGYFPTTVGFLNELTRRINGRVLGQPTMLPRPATYRRVTVPEDLKKTFSEVRVDIASLFDETVEQVNRLILDYDYKYTWRERINNRIKSVYENILSARDIPPYKYLKTISSFDGILNSISPSAYINLREGIATLNEIDSKTLKHDLTYADLSYSVSGGTATELSPITNAKDDNINSAWHLEVFSATKGMISVTITVTLDEKKTMSRIVLRGHTPGTARADLSFDASGSATVGAKPFLFNSYVGWEITPITTDTFNIILSKTDADEIIDTGYRYIFGLQNIGVLYVEYEQEATLVTEAIEFIDENKEVKEIGNFTVTPTEEKPLDTDTEWYYSFDVADSKAWYPFTPGEKVYRAPDPTVTTSTITATVSGGSPLVYDRITYYKLATVPIDAENIVIKPAPNHWRVDSFRYPYDESPAFVDLYPDPTPTIYDFVDPSSRAGQIVPYSTIKTRFMSRTETRMDMLKPYFERIGVSTSFDPYYKKQLQYMRPGVPQAVRVTTAPAYETLESVTPKERVMHKFTGHIYVKSDIGKQYLNLLKSLMIYLPPPIFGASTGGRSTVYFNSAVTTINRSVLNVDTEDRPYLYLNLETGWNTLEIVLNNYRPGYNFDIGLDKFTDLINGTNSSGVFGSLTPKACIEWWGEKYPLSKVSYFELFYQTARTDNTRFSVKDNEVYVNYVPYYPHTMSYQVTDLSQLPAKMWLKAELFGDVNFSNITPRIYEYKVEMDYE